MHKRCARCKRTKPISDFSIEKSAPDGHCHWCRKCKHAYRAKSQRVNTRRWRKENPYTLKERKKCSKCKLVKDSTEFSRCRTTSDGLSPICKVCRPLQQCRIKVPSGTACEICGTTIDIVRDHSHQAGCFRGFLCRRCNTGLGCFSDNPELLLKAAIYAEKPASKERYKR